MKFHPMLFLLALSCQAHTPPTEQVAADKPRIVGPDHVLVDLLRTSPGNEKIYVQVDVGLEEPGIFLVDTGASISTISEELAQDLSLQPHAEDGFLEGLGGTVQWSSVRLPAISLGDMTMSDVLAAVAVQGVPSYTGAMPLAGILGNNVWQHFVLAVDYPAERLELFRPGAWVQPEQAEPMLFDGLHCYTMVGLTARPQGSMVALSQKVLLAIDTGARGFLLSGVAGEALSAVATEGDEPIYGIGGDDDLPPSTFLKRTRRIHLDSAQLGGRTVDDPGVAQWINFTKGSSIGPDSLAGLVGFNALKNYRAVLDYQGGRFALTESTGERRERDGHQLLLEQDLDRYGDDPRRGMFRARLLAWLDRTDEAITTLAPYLELNPEDSEASVFMARLHRYSGDMAACWASMSTLGPAELLEQGELLSAVNGHILEGRMERAKVLVQAAMEQSREDDQVWVAAADLALASADPAQARISIARANELDENPDGHLLRRARIAMAEGDRMAALSHLRRLLEIYPLSGFAIWFYADIAQNDDERQMLVIDTQRAMDRLHPEDRPRDFQIAAYRAAGRLDRIDPILESAMAEDCDSLDKDTDTNNCQAWYLGMAGRDLDQALEKAILATTEAPHRPDYLDTLAVVHWRRGELKEAAQVSLRAVSYAPDDIYLLWQHENMQRRLEQAREQP